MASRQWKSMAKKVSTYSCSYKYCMVTGISAEYVPIAVYRPCRSYEYCIRAAAFFYNAWKRTAAVNSVEVLTIVFSCLEKFSKIVWWRETTFHGRNVLLGADACTLANDAINNYFVVCCWMATWIIRPGKVHSQFIVPTRMLFREILKIFLFHFFSLELSSPAAASVMYTHAHNFCPPLFESLFLPWKIVVGVDLYTCMWAKTYFS